MNVVIQMFSAALCRCSQMLWNLCNTICPKNSWSPVDQRYTFWLVSINIIVLRWVLETRLSLYHSSHPHDNIRRLQDRRQTSGHYQKKWTVLFCPIFSFITYPLPPTYDRIGKNFFIATYESRLLASIQSAAFKSLLLRSSDIYLCHSVHHADLLLHKTFLWP